MNTLQERIALVLRNKRIAMGMSQEQLAEIVDKTPSFIGQMERGECLPRIETLQALISCLGIDANLFFSDEVMAEDSVAELLDLANHMDEKKRSLLIEFARLLYKTEL